MKYFIAMWVVFLLMLTPSGAQVNTVHMRVSLLTCAPGAELYSSFGHTAIRIQDSTLHTDYVYNYGTFNFDQPNFYLKFIRGKLDFMLAIEPFEDFMYEYQYTQRSVSEQELRLSDSDKLEIQGFLRHNYLPANRYYKYDFLYDNCATRIRDILFNKIKSVSLTDTLVSEGTSFRDLLYVYLDKAGQPWSKLGIDILLGSRIDKKVDNATAMFLPDFLAAGIAHAHYGKMPYQLADHKIIDLPPSVTPSNKYLPLILFTIICAVLLLVFYLGRHKKTLTLILDSLLLYITGLLGVLLLFMWFATDHKACADNFNLLWAMPLNLIAGFFIWKKRSWLRKYFLIMLLLTALLLAFWMGTPQHFNIALLPFCVLMLVRYGQLAKNN